METFTHLMVCNGHHWDPKYPEYPGEFSGEWLHSHDFKRVPERWRGKRILIIGAGNSACDVAVEVSRITRHVDISMRSAQWFIPKYLFGMPADALAARGGWLPGFIGHRLLARLLRLVQGAFSDYGLPEPDWSPFEGWELAGFARTTLSRGEVIVDDYRVVGREGRGQWLPRSFAGVPEGEL